VQWNIKDESVFWLGYGGIDVDASGKGENFVCVFEPLVFSF
jgi:hypothetical protein